MTPSASLVVQLYWWSLDIGAAHATALQRLLAPEENARAARLSLPVHRQRFIAARAGLRLLLAQALDAPAASLVFAYGPQGKPFLPAQALHFNLSHSHAVAVAALANGLELGVDLERVDDKRNLLGIARRFFTAREAAWLESHAPQHRPHAFCRLWTCKEAFLKACGQGLAFPLDRVEVAFTADGLALWTPDPATDWRACEFDLLPGYCAALVTPNPVRAQVRPFEWEGLAHAPPPGPS